MNTVNELLYDHEFRLLNLYLLFFAKKNRNLKNFYSSKKKSSKKSSYSSFSLLESSF